MRDNSASVYPRILPAGVPFDESQNRNIARPGLDERDNSSPEKVNRSRTRGSFASGEWLSREEEKESEKDGAERRWRKRERERGAEEEEGEDSPNFSVFRSRTHAREHARTYTREHAIKTPRKTRVFYEGFVLAASISSTLSLLGALTQKSVCIFLL